MEPYIQFDAIGIFLSGGASNIRPSYSLGGAQSIKLVRGMSPIYSIPVQGLIIEDASFENGEGEASISIVSGEATYTPPDGLAGTAVAIAEGERKILQGLDASKTVRIYRTIGDTFQGSCHFKLVDMMNGVFSMSNVPDSMRQAGGICYRAIFLKALQGAVEEVEVWITTTGQSSYSVAVEVPESDGAIQTISDESVEPTGLSWVDAVDQNTSLLIGGIAGGDSIGLWVRRTFPMGGIVSVKEQVNFYLRFKGE